jgi:membrane protease YdiL (CAAX protease family)
MPLAWLFEHHLWQFGVGMLVITVLSRGHLWSYGINSSDIRLSMSILLKFYMVASAIVAVVVVAPMVFSGMMPEYLVNASRVDMIAWILFQWMAAAVADNILYFGLFQTLLLKYWQEKISVKPFEVPVAILMTTVLFAAGRTNVPVYGNHLIEYLFALAIGAYSGLVYFRTRSLLTPMLSQAFFYGLPFVVRFVYLAAAGR